MSIILTRHKGTILFMAGCLNRDSTVVIALEYGMFECDKKLMKYEGAEIWLMPRRIVRGK